MEIPMEETETVASAKDQEVPAEQMRKGTPSKAQMTPDPIGIASHRSLAEAKDDGELWLIEKRLLDSPNEPVQLDARTRFIRKPKGKCGGRQDGDECQQFPTHLYVVGRISRNQGGDVWT